MSLKKGAAFLLATVKRSCVNSFVILSRRKLIVGASVLLIGAAGLIWAMHGRSTLDDYVAQLRARGERLYFTDPPLPKMTNGTPGLDRLSKAIDQIRRPEEVRLMALADPGTAKVEWQQPMAGADAGSSHALAWPTLEAQVRSNETCLREVRDVLARPEPDTGRTNSILPLTPVLTRTRDASRLLAAALIVALRETNSAEAFANLQALARLGRMEQDEAFLITQLVRLAVVRLGLCATWEALQSDVLNDEQWSRLQVEWSQVNVLNAPEVDLSASECIALTCSRKAGAEMETR